MAKSRKPSTDEIELFRRSVGPVRKIHHDKIVAGQETAAVTATSTCAAVMKRP